MDFVIGGELGLKKYRCVIFDLDGTLLNTEEMNIVPLKRLIKEELNQEIAYEELLKYRAYPGKKALDLLGFIDIEKSYSKWVQYVNDYEFGASLYHGWDEVIIKLDEKGILCGISSSKTRAQYEIDFLKTGLQKYMKGIVLAEDTEKHKPDPQPLLKAAKIIGAEPSETLYIGDTVVDYQATKAAGMDFALAKWGAISSDGIVADYELDEPLDLLKIFIDIDRTRAEAK